MGKRYDRFQEFWFPLFVIVLSVLGFLWVAVRLILNEPIIPAASASVTVQAASTFDHSTCQYPERKTNPPDGCDNSDPANPACVVKSGYENC